MAADVLSIKAWDQYPWLQAGFSTRQGGATSVYGAPGEMNLGWTKEDDPGIVAANRERMVSLVAQTPASDWQLVTMRQVHGGTVTRIERDGSPLATPEGKAIVEADGLATNEPGLMLGVQTADCVPVLLADTRLHTVAAIHAGWRGTLARIAEHGVAAMERDFGSHPQDIVAAIGPAIRRCCFAVGNEVRDKFTAEFLYAPDLFVEDLIDGKPQLFMDLHTANQRQLIGAGLPPESITTLAECSACTRTAAGHRRYFSHRAEHGITGRMMSVIGIAESE
ncbi:peptidoglycan editing factor PgeF [Granulicella sp. 5B5]|uniref:peptidoglycan editing factor PgeF n=1 Tax=Granulicella sp. 5B5 TaxID=1617967 RepID=UPI0015F4E5E1|nr:peptidoglycan editing factor PgeF [Granulicella sp. 5B5]QMV19261.1 peptidoglycan editing factor PgeF [Granulicella sp. 5B5]